MLNKKLTTSLAALPLLLASQFSAASCEISMTNGDVGISAGSCIGDNEAEYSLDGFALGQYPNGFILRKNIVTQKGKYLKVVGKASDVQGGGYCRLSVYETDRDGVMESLVHREVSKMGVGGKVTCDISYTLDAWIFEEDSNSGPDYSPITVSVSAEMDNWQEWARGFELD